MELAGVRAPSELLSTAPEPFPGRQQHRVRPQTSGGCGYSVHTSRFRSQFVSLFTAMRRKVRGRNVQFCFSLDVPLIPTSQHRPWNLLAYGPPRSYSRLLPNPFLADSSTGYGLKHQADVDIQCTPLA